MTGRRGAARLGTTRTAPRSSTMSPPCYMYSARLVFVYNNTLYAFSQESSHAASTNSYSYSKTSRTEIENVVLCFRQTSICSQSTEIQGNTSNGIKKDITREGCDTYFNYTYLHLIFFLFKGTMTSRPITQFLFMNHPAGSRKGNGKMIWFTIF